MGIICAVTRICRICEPYQCLAVSKRAKLVCPLWINFGQIILKTAAQNLLPESQPSPKFANKDQVQCKWIHIISGYEVEASKRNWETIYDDLWHITAVFFLLVWQYQRATDLKCGIFNGCEKFATFKYNLIDIQKGNFRE